MMKSYFKSVAIMIVFIILLHGFENILNSMGYEFLPYVRIAIVVLFAIALNVFENYLKHKKVGKQLDQRIDKLQQMKSKS